jgi:predicted transcriptional regulator
MQAIQTTENVQLTLPNADLSFLRAISRKMGWSLKRQRKSGIEKGLEDIRKGNVFHAKNSEDLIKQILG